MIAKRRKKTAETGSTARSEISLDDAIAWLEKRGTKKQIRDLERYGITATRPFGVTVGEIKKYAKTIGQSHELAAQLWDTGRYEARLLAIFVDEPERVTARQMNEWAADFDNWALVDTACFHLFDRTKHAWRKTAQWAKAKPEFTKRAAFALLWALSVHDKDAPDASFREGLGLIEGAAEDERKFVKKAVDMALRAIGKRNPALNKAAIKTAAGLAKREDTTARWIGTHALRELESAGVRKRLGRVKFT